MHETKFKMYAWNCVVPWHHTYSGYATGPHYKCNHCNVARTLWIPLILGVKGLHIICNMGTHGLPDMFTGALELCPCNMKERAT